MMSKSFANETSPDVTLKTLWPGCARPGFSFADGDGVFAGGQLRDGDGEIFPVNFLAKRGLIAARAFNGQLTHRLCDVQNRR